MNRRNRKATSPDEHLEALGPLLKQLKTHLTASAAKKGTYGDYLRLLEFYQETRHAQTREIIIGWVNSENAGNSPA
jgi:hypothetical protein